MGYQSHFILNVLRDLRSRAEEAAKLHPGLRHMLVLPPGECIQVPTPSGCHAVPSFASGQELKICKFGNTKVVGPLPPRINWPKGAKPLQAVVAEQSFEPYRTNARKPHRIHLFFGGTAGAFDALQALADELAGILNDVTRALFGDHSPFPDGVFYVSPDCLHDRRAADLDSWLCTVHWWAWVWTESPFRTKPCVLHGGKSYETDRRDSAVTTKLAYSLFSADVFTASAATLSLILRFFDERPTLYWDADYPDIPKADRMSREEVADLGKHFIRYVTEWIEWEKLANLAAATAPSFEPGCAGASEFGNRILELDGQKNEAAARIRRYGPPFAEALERYGRDSSGVLSIVHCAGPSGGGVKFIFESWKQNKIAFQRDLIQIRQANERATSNPDTSTTHKSTPANDPKQMPIVPPTTDDTGSKELMQMGAASKTTGRHAKGTGGRPSVSKPEARNREELIEQWKKAKTARVCQKDFCSDNKISLAYLAKCLNWAAQRRRRTDNS
ncbi:MAG: hypothetical protein AABZ47_10080 [Planctomycetota bacterium]